MDEAVVSSYGTDDPKLGNHIKPFNEIRNRAKVTLVGFPYDEGVRRNGGRVGAAEGPQAFRASIQRLGSLINSEFNIDLRKIPVADFGDVAISLTLEEAHQTLKNIIKNLVNQGIVPFVIGGGNDQSYPNASGLMEALSGGLSKDLTVINVDAHLDVRPLLSNGKAHSGSPFRQLLEDPTFKACNGRLIEFACQGHQCSKIHWEFVEQHEGSYLMPLSTLRNHKVKSIEEQFKDILSECKGPIFVSFDIDSIASRDCPGVSCPASIGLTADEAIKICYESGLNENVKLFDVSEFNPTVESYRTGKLVGLMLYYFLMGFSKRFGIH